MKKTVLTHVAAFVLGVVAYVGFFSLTTEKATVIEEVAGTELLMGDLMDADIAHPASGMFSIVATEGGMRAIKFSDDFAIVHAPDPHVRVNDMVIAKVVNYEGAQVYPIPNFIGEEIKNVYVWCEIADIPLAIGLFDGAKFEMNVFKKDFEMDMDMDMDSMKMKMGGMMAPERTDALVVLGTTGNPKPYAMEMMGESKGKVSGAFTSVIKEALTMEEMDTNAGFFGYAPEIAIVDGMTFRMVAPAHVKDNFVVSDMDGNWTRYDLGVDEGTNMITKVSSGTMMK